jgi:hypothetical protein
MTHIEENREKCVNIDGGVGVALLTGRNRFYTVGDSHTLLRKLDDRVTTVTVGLE